MLHFATKSKKIMNKKDVNSDILSFWKAVEQLTPFNVETEKISGNVKSIQKEVLGEKDIPWLNKDRFLFKKTDSHTWVYTTFLGIIECNSIITQMKKLLDMEYPDYDLQQSKGLSCLCSFQLNIDGMPIAGSLQIPDYFITMSCLAQRKQNPNNWLDQSSDIKRKFTDVFDNLCDFLHNNNDNKVNFTILSEFLADIIKLSRWHSIISDNLITNTAIIYSSNVPIPKNNQNDEAIEVSDPDSSILNSFFIDDLNIVLEASKKDPNTLLGKGITEYLGTYSNQKKEDICKDKHFLKKYTSPNMLPAIRWPNKGCHPLSLTQQIAVNLALDRKDNGLFSVNGPPGTGKSTLLKDIISGVILERAKALSKLDNPHDAFEQYHLSKIEGYNYKAWQLKSSLIGHEIVVASSNNGAVENISKELPRFNEIDEKWDIDYFANIASSIANDSCWGLSAAVLGNKKNRTMFFNAFWDAKPKEDSKNPKDMNFGLQYLLEQIKPTSNWQEAKSKFLETLKEYEKIQLELVKLENIIDYLPTQKNELAKIEKKLSLIKADTIKTNKSIDDYTNELLALENSYSRKKELLESYKSLKPSWLVIIKDFITRDSYYKNWHNKYYALLDEISVILDKTINLPEQISSLKTLLQKQEILKNNNLLSYNNLNKKILYNEKKILFYMEKMGKNIADDNFWDLPDEELHRLSPWLFDRLHHLRGQLFIDSLNLHRSFIINSSEKIMNNLRCMNLIITRGSWPEKQNDLLPSIWASFFMAVPVVSTTFASFSSLFKGMKKESIGWLLIDEAGQAAPQAAVGAIYRAKKSIIVGDPLQIRPVVTIPKAMNDALMEYFNISEQWSPREESVQTLADRANIHGTHIGKSDKKQWVGCPLRVHRRCNDPMFSVANNIAYDGLMIQATNNKKSPIEFTFPESKWVDVKGVTIKGNWIKEEGEAVISILSKIFEESDYLPSLYIISPFNNVAFNMKQLLRNNAHKLHNPNNENIYLWINKYIGTIHTFQGKQAEMVILLLGGDPKKTGAITWAASAPNILNVGITRAKNLIFVVGNHDLWSEKPYFQDLSIAINKTTIEKILDLDYAE
jgi:hypothetical protein